MATVRVRIVILTVQITLSVCPFNCMAHTANTEFAAVGVAIIGVSWGSMCSKDARGLTIPTLQDKCCGVPKCSL
jgi:dissimilatory sulfite reductase (desulfoviridin) alpha/beta subunit